MADFNIADFDWDEFQEVKPTGGNLKPAESSDDEDEDIKPEIPVTKEPKKAKEPEKTEKTEEPKAKEPEKAPEVPEEEEEEEEEEVAKVIDWTSTVTKLGTALGIDIPNGEIQEEDALDFITETIQLKVEDGIDAVSGFVDTIADLAEDGTLVPNILSGMAAITAAQWAMNAAMAANPVGLVIAGIVALGALGVAIVTNWNSISKAIFSVTAGITKGIGQIVVSVGADWRVLWCGAGHVFVHTWQQWWSVYAGESELTTWYNADWGHVCVCSGW